MHLRVEGLIKIDKPLDNLTKEKAQIEVIRNEIECAQSFGTIQVKSLKWLCIPSTYAVGFVLGVEFGL